MMTQEMLPSRDDHGARERNGKPGGPINYGETTGKTAQFVEKSSVLIFYFWYIYNKMEIIPFIICWEV